MLIKYIEKGVEHDFKRIDTMRELETDRYFRSGGLLYCYLDHFNIKVISIEDIISTSAPI